MLGSKWSTLPSLLSFSFLCYRYGNESGCVGPNRLHPPISELIIIIITVCVSIGTNTDITGDLPSMNRGLNELNIEGALNDELKVFKHTCTKQLLQSCNKFTLIMCI